MARKLHEIIAHIRAVAGNTAVRTTLIHTEDLELLCDAAENKTIHDAADQAVAFLAGGKPADAQRVLEDALGV